MLPSLADKCAEYLRRDLKALNVFCILPHAQKFEDEDLEDRCWKVIEEQTEEALKSDEFVTVERSLVETVVEREVLNVKEVELFKAVDRWATEQSQRRGITPDGESKRLIIGEEILKAIRFPLMSQQEFASVVIDSELLNLDEVGDMMKHFSDVSTTALPFIQAPRIPRIDAAIIHRCQRFRAFKTGWGYGKSAVCIKFSVSKPIMLHGVQHFGSEGEKYTVSTEVKDNTGSLQSVYQRMFRSYGMTYTTNGSLVKQSGSYVSEKDKICSYYGFSVKFDRPVYLVENKQYKLESFINGAKSSYGTTGLTSVECQGVKFTFGSSLDDTSGTSETQGQFPVLFWSA